MRRLNAFLLCAAIVSVGLAFTPKAGQTLGADNGKETVMANMATPSTDVFKYDGCDHVFKLNPVVVEQTDITSDGKFYDPNKEIFIARYVFDPADFKLYPEYTPGQLSDGFAPPVDRPARY